MQTLTNCVDFVDQILNGGDSVSAQLAGDNIVVDDGQSVAVDLSVTTLVDQFSDGLEVGVTVKGKQVSCCYACQKRRNIPVSDVGLDELQHLEGSLVELEEGTVVDLFESQQLENLSGLGVETSNTKMGSRCQWMHKKERMHTL